MSSTRSSVRTTVLTILGDTAEKIWSSSEIYDYIDEGYNLWCRLTRALWAWTYSNDTDGTGAYALPDDLTEIDRITWDWIRLEPLSHRFLRNYDSRYRVQTGQVQAYTLDEDGIGYLRKWPIPNTTVTPFTKTIATVGNSGAERASNVVTVKTTAAHGLTVGSMVTISGVTETSFNGTFQVITVPSTTTFTLWQYGPNETSGGGTVSINTDSRNMRIEYFRRGASLDESTDGFEIPERWVKAIRFFALWKALARQGDGQDKTFAQHFEQRWQAMVARAKRRNIQAKSERVGRFGAAPEAPAVIPRPRLPWNRGTPAPVGVSSTTVSGGLIQVTTSTAHGLSTGDKVYIQNVSTMTDANGYWYVTVVDATAFTLDESSSSQSDGSGGTVVKYQKAGS